MPGSADFGNHFDTGTIVIHKDVQGPGGEDVTDASNNSQVSLDTGTGQVITDNLTVTYSDVPVGSHTITESLIDPDYTLYGISSTAGGSGNTGGLTINVTTGTNNVYVTNRQHSGTITVVKNVVNAAGGPVSDSHSFTANLHPGSQSSSFAEGNNAVFTVNPGTYTVTETDDPAYLELGCLTVGTLKTDIVVVSGGAVTITCTNQQNTGTINIVKVRNGGSPTQQFGFTTSLIPSPPSPAFSLDDNGDPTLSNTKIFTGVTAGTHTVSEITNPGWTLDSIVCSDQDSTSGLPAAPTATINLAAGETVTCTFTNSADTGSVKVNKLADTNGDGTFETLNPGTFTWKFNGIGSYTMGSTLTGLSTGIRTVDENSPASYHLVGWFPGAPTSTQYSCTNLPADTANHTLPASVTITKDSLTEITICNATDTGTIIVHKDVQGPNGEDVTDASNNSEVSLDAGIGQIISDNFTVTYNNVSVGNHTITESVIDPDYTLYGISTTAGQVGTPAGLVVNVASGQTTDVYVTNRQHSGTITVIKDVVNPNGGPVSDTHSFTVNLSPGSQSSLFAEEDDAVFTVNPGTYTATESADPEYTSLRCLILGKTDIVVLPGESKTVTCTNQQKKAHIIVEKLVKGPQGEDVTDTSTLFDFNIAGVGNIDLTDNQTHDFEANPGTYNVVETPDADYTLFECSADYEGASIGSPITQGEQVTVGSGDTVTVTCVNNQKPGSVSGVKWSDLNGDGDRDPGEPGLAGWKIYTDIDHDGIWDTAEPYDLTAANGAYQLGVLPGSYRICEVPQDGWHQTYPNDSEINNCHEVTVGSNGSADSVNFGNVQLSDIHGFKWNDLNGNGEFNDEPLLGGWTINLYKLVGDAWIFQDDYVTEDDGPHLGWYWFTGLLPGQYKTCEELQTSWLQTYPGEDGCHHFQLPNDQVQTENSILGAEYDFGNILQNPILTITKVNDASGDKVPGDSVLYTLTVEATQSAAYNVRVTDLLPDGFTYRVGSWTAVSDVRGDLKGLGVTTEPTYASPGTWILGDMAIGETVTLTYLADISGDQKPGLYKDVAWAIGCKQDGSDCVEGDGNDTLALAQNPGFIDTNFVGTAVNIVKDQQNGGTLNKREGQVLGASTELPATGADAVWLTLAALFILFGLGLIIAGKYARRHYV